MTHKLNPESQASVDRFLAKIDEAIPKSQADTYGLALMMIREGAADPVKIARDALAKFGR